MRKFNFKYINWVRRLVNGDEFKVLDFIENTMALKGCSRVQIYRDTIAVGCGWTNKKAGEKVTRITNGLVEKGFLKKDLVYEGLKSLNWYTLVMDRFEAECGETKSTYHQKSRSNEVVDNPKVGMNEGGDTPENGVLNNTTIILQNTLENYHNTLEEPQKTLEEVHNTRSIWKDVADWDNAPIPEVVGVLEEDDFSF